MQDEQWIDLIEKIKEKNEVEREKEEIVTKDDVGNEMINQIDRLIFSTDIGDFKIERVTRPQIIDKKVHYSHTAGAKGLVEYILSPTEVTHKVTIYKKNGHDWEELSIGADSLTF